MSGREPWSSLDLAPDSDRTAIRRAYAQKLKALDLDVDIEAYARLRGARDHALALAGRALAEEPVMADAALTAADDGVEPGIGVSAASQPDEFPSEDVASDPTPPEILLAVLFPHGEYSDSALDHGEWEQGQAAAAAVVARALESPIDEQAAIEQWLAHQLASAWPRSAHLIGDVADRLGWGGQAGEISEEPAQRFINERLRGMRFVEKVQEPGHPLRRAWIELTRGGEKPFYASFKTKKRDVEHLLSVVRESYPEVEIYLDPTRVASWERPMDSDIERKIALFAFCVFVVLFLAFALNDDVNTEYKRAAAAYPKAAKAALVTDLFDGDAAAKNLPVLAPELASAIEKYGEIVPNDARGAEVMRIRILNLQRIMAQRAANGAAFDDLVEIKRVRLALLNQSAVRSQPGLCDDVITGRIQDERVPADAKLRSHERALYTRLLTKGLFVSVNAKPMAQASVPGFVLDDIRRTSGLSAAAIERALKGQAGSVEQCAFQIALMDSVLRQPAKVSPELLRML